MVGSYRLSKINTQIGENTKRLTIAKVVDRYFVAYFLKLISIPVNIIKADW